MMGGVSPETCWAIRKHWYNKFYHTVAFCWFFLWNLKCYILGASPGANKWKERQTNISHFRSYGTDLFLTNLSTTNMKLYKNSPGILQSKTFSFLYTAKLHLSGINRTASLPDMQIIRIIGFLFRNRLHWQFAVLLLLFTVCTCV